MFVVAAKYFYDKKQRALGVVPNIKIFSRFITTSPITLSAEVLFPVVSGRSALHRNS